MIRVNIVAVGRLKDKFWTEAFSEYQKRLAKFCSFKVYEIADAQGSPEMQKTTEGKHILKKLKGVPILLDIGGDMVSSEGLSHLIDQSATGGNSELTFIIGGSHGVSQEVKNTAHKHISFGRITFPHRLVRVVLAEQIYRAFTIINNMDYHK